MSDMALHSSQASDPVLSQHSLEGCQGPHISTVQSAGGGAAVEITSDCAESEIVYISAEDSDDAQSGSCRMLTETEITSVVSGRRFKSDDINRLTQLVHTDEDHTNNKSTLMNHKFPRSLAVISSSQVSNISDGTNRSPPSTSSARSSKSATSHTKPARNDRASKSWFASPLAPPKKMASAPSTTSSKSRLTKKGKPTRMDTAPAELHGRLSNVQGRDTTSVCPHSNTSSPRVISPTLPAHFTPPQQTTTAPSLPDEGVDDDTATISSLVSSRLSITSPSSRRKSVTPRGYVTKSSVKNRSTPPLKGQRTSRQPSSALTSARPRPNSTGEPHSEPAPLAAAQSLSPARRKHTLGSPALSLKATWCNYVSCTSDCSRQCEPKSDEIHPAYASVCRGLGNDEVACASYYAYCKMSDCI